MEVVNSREMVDEVVDRLLDMNPDPVPKFILLKEFKMLSKGSNEFQNLYEEVLAHPYLKKIENTQDDFGCWGDFHCGTEQIIRNCLFMGMDESFICLKKVRLYILEVLNGNDTWHQRQEKQDNPYWWLDMFIPLVSSAMLSLIDPNNPILAEKIEIWRSFALEAFQDNHYCAEVEKKSQYKHFKVKTKRIIPFFNYYVILLLTSSHNILPDKLDTLMLDYCMSKENGIYYIYDKPPKTPVAIDNKNIYNWLRCISILSRYKSWYGKMNNITSFLWEQRNVDGLWDIQIKPYGSCFPISNSWRKDKNRIIDSSIFMLRIINQWKGC